MKDKLRGFLGFLGLVEDEYGEFGSTNAPRPFSEFSPEPEPEWAPTPPPAPVARQFPTQPASSAPRRPVTPQPPGVPRRSSSVSVLEGVNGSSRVRPIANPNAAQRMSAFSPERDVAIVSPTTYDDSRRITDLLRSNRAVVLTTLNIDAGLSRRLVDFTAGTAYALNAKIEMLIRGVYLVSPQGMHVGPEMKERLRESNFHGLDYA